MPPAFTKLSVPDYLRRKHERRGGGELRRWIADVADGVLRVMAGREPFRRDGNCGWHVSVSVAKSGAVCDHALPQPTDDEFRAACKLIPEVASWEEEKTYPSCATPLSPNPNRSGRHNDPTQVVQR